MSHFLNASELSDSERNSFSNAKQTSLNTGIIIICLSWSTVYYFLKSGILCCRKGTALLMGLLGFLSLNHVCLYFCIGYIDTCIYPSWTKRPWLFLQSATGLPLFSTEAHLNMRVWLRQFAPDEIESGMFSYKMAGLWPKRSTTFGFDCAQAGEPNLAKEAEWKSLTGLLTHRFLQLANNVMWLAVGRICSVYFLRVRLI